MADVRGYKDFYAHCDHMPGSEPALRVGGKVVCPTDGWSAKLRPHQRSGPPPFNPLSLELDLVLEEPGDGAAEVITEIDVEEYRIDEPVFDYHDVFIFGDGQHGDGPGDVVVVHTQ
jgi:hypothetical protein